MKATATGIRSERPALSRRTATSAIRPNSTAKMTPNAMPICLPSRLAAAGSAARGRLREETSRTTANAVSPMTTMATRAYALADAPRQFAIELDGPKGAEERKDQRADHDEQRVGRGHDHLRTAGAHRATAPANCGIWLSPSPWAERLTVGVTGGTDWEELLGNT